MVGDRKEPRYLGDRKAKAPHRLQPIGAMETRSPYERTASMEDVTPIQTRPSSIYRWFDPSPHPRLNADQFEAWLQEVLADPKAHGMNELGCVRCPCCQSLFELDCLSSHARLDKLLEDDVESNARCDREHWGALLEANASTASEARTNGYLELHPFASTAEQRVADLEVLVEQLGRQVVRLANVTIGLARVGDVLGPFVDVDKIPPPVHAPWLDAVMGLLPAGEQPTCPSCGDAYPGLDAGHHEWLLTFEERGAAGAAELLQLFDLQASNGNAEDGELPWVEFRDWAARHHWTDPAGVADFASIAEELCNLRAEIIRRGAREYEAQLRGGR